MKKYFLTLCAFAAWSGCVSDRLPDEVANLSALEFGSAHSVMIAGLKGENQATTAFHGYLRVTPWRRPPPAIAGEITGLMAGIIRTDLAIERQPSRGEEVVRLHSFCFNPGYAVLLRSDRGARDFLVCLECDELRVFDEAGHVWSHHLDKAEAGRLATLLNGA